MPGTPTKTAPSSVPTGYAAIPLSEEQTAAPVRLCVLARLEADPAAGHLVALRATLDAAVYLGCLVDAGGHVHDWLEVWVQRLDGIARGLSERAPMACNAMLDARWARHAAACERFERPVLLTTGWESEHPDPTYLDVARRRLVCPVHRESGERWRLCTDDGRLAEAGLPPYSTTLHRYLVAADKEGAAWFVPLSEESPSAEACLSSEALGGVGGLAPLNPGAGLMLVRRVAPIGLEAFADVLGGAKWTGVPHGRSSLGAVLNEWVEMPDAAEDRSVGGIGGPRGAGGAAGEGLFLGQQGRWGRLIEALHLKFRLLADAAASVRGMAEVSQRPLLNLTPESFQVRLGPPARGLPRLWSARVLLADPGCAVALPVSGGDAAYFVTPGDLGPSVYRPAVVGRGAQGSGLLRVRDVLTGEREEAVVEGTLATDERIEVGRNDLVWLHAVLGGTRVDLYGRLSAESAMAAGEWRLRTVQQRFDPVTLRRLTESKGVPLPRTNFEVIPVLSTPVDLYSLAVLGVRVLLTNSSTTLPVQLDEALSLARQAGEVASASDEGLPGRIAGLFAKDKRWLASLGPHRLTEEPVEPAAALDVVPPDLWFETLAALVRMFPGVGPDSTAADYGDARPGGLHLVFDRALADLDRLLCRSRSLIVIDWAYNREIHGVLRQFLTLGGDGAAAPTRAGKAR